MRIHPLKLIALTLLVAAVGHAQPNRPGPVRPTRPQQPEPPDRVERVEGQPQVVRAGLLTRVPASLEPGEQNYLALGACVVPAQFHQNLDRKRPESIFVCWGTVHTPPDKPGGDVRFTGRLFSLEDFRPVGQPIRFGTPIDRGLPRALYCRAFRNGNILVVYPGPHERDSVPMRQIVLTAPADEPRQYRVATRNPVTAGAGHGDAPPTTLTLLAGGNVMAVQSGARFVFVNSHGQRVDRMGNSAGGLGEAERTKVGLPGAPQNPALCVERSGLVRVFANPSANGGPLRTWLLDAHGYYVSTDVGRRELPACTPLLAAPDPDDGALALVRMSDRALGTCRAYSMIATPRALDPRLPATARFEAVPMPTGGFFVVYWEDDEAKPMLRRITPRGAWAGPPMALNPQHVWHPQLTLVPLGPDEGEGDQVVALLGTSRGLQIGILK